MALGQSDRIQFFHDGRFDLALAPTNLRVATPGVGMVVAAAVVDVLVVPAAVELAADQFAGHGEVAAGTTEEATRERDVGVAGSTVATVKDVPAGVEHLAINQQAVTALEHLPVAFEFTDVEPVVEDVRECRAVEARLAGTIRVSFGCELVGQTLERESPAGVELEDADDGLGLLRVRHDRLVAIIDVDVAIRCKAGGPALLDLLVHALDDLGAQVVRVVLRHRRHHVERQCTRRARAELVLDEGQLDAAGIFQFLKPNRISHVATDAVEFVGEDGVDLLAFGVGLDPLEHLVERDAVGTALGGLGDDELADDGPARLRCLLAHGANLRVDGIALALFAGRHSCPGHHVHQLASLRIRTSNSPIRLTFMRISTASSSLIGRPYDSDQSSMVSASRSSGIHAMDSGRSRAGPASCSSIRAEHPVDSRGSRSWAKLADVPAESAPSCW